MSEPLLTVAELAQRLGVSTDTIYRRVSEGTIPAYRVGPIIRCDWDKVCDALSTTTKGAS